MKWGGQIIFPANGGRSIDTIDHFWGSVVLTGYFVGGVEINLVDFVGVWSHSMIIMEEAENFNTKFKNRRREIVL